MLEQQITQVRGRWWSGDENGRFKRIKVGGRDGHNNPLYFYISVAHQHFKAATNIEIQSPTFTNRHQLQVTNMTMSPTSLSLYGI